MQAVRYIAENATLTGDEQACDRGVRAFSLGYTKRASALLVTEWLVGYHSNRFRCAKVALKIVKGHMF